MTTPDAPHGTDGRLLERSPLARVLVQIRWPELANFNLDEVSAAMGRRLGDVYPLVSRQAEVQVTFSISGPREQENGYITRFSSASEEWTVSIGNSFVALDTSVYQGHGDLIERLKVVLTALNESATIPFATRIGYRYTNRVVGEEDLSRLSEHFSPSVLGGMGTVAEDRELVHTITESVYRIETSFLLVRSAQVGPNESIDPTLPPLDRKSWILDIDAYDESRSPFTPDAIADRCSDLAGIGSEQFRSVVTESFYGRYS